MSCKIKLKDLIYQCLLFLIILNLHILDFFDITKYVRFLTVIMSVALNLLIKYNSGWKNRYRFWNIWISIICILLFFEVVYGYAFGTLGVVFCLGLSYCYLYLTLIFPILYLFEDEKYKKRLMRAICFWTVVSLIQRVIVWTANSFFHKDIMHYLLYEMGGAWMRRGYQRMFATCFSGILFAIAVKYFLTSKKYKYKIISFICIVANILYAQFIFMSRMQVVCFLLSLVVAMFINKSNGKRILFVICLIPISLYLMNTHFVMDFVDSLSVNTYSVGTRFREIEYYLNIVKGHKLFGILYLYDTDYIEGTNGQFFLSDLGILAKFFEFGIVGFILFLLPIFRIAYQFITKRMIDDFDKITVYAIGSYTLFWSLLGNDLYGYRYIFATPFIYAYFECLFSGKEIKRKSQELRDLDKF